MDYDNDRNGVILNGVPQGSFLGPLLFMLYTSDIGHIIPVHGLLHHCYADDTQFHFFCKPSEAAVLKVRVIRCISDIAEWMSSNRLKLNPAKSEILWCATAIRLHLVDSSQFLLADGAVTPTVCVRNLEAYFDASMSMLTHIGHVISSSFYQLRCIRAIRKSILISTDVQLVNRFVVSRDDYCNSLLAGLTACQLDCVQAILNGAARLVYGRQHNKHVTPLIRDKLHWLRIRERVQFKCCLLVYKALNDVAPTYIANFCSRVADVLVAHHCVLLLTISLSFRLESLSLVTVHFLYPDLPLGTCCLTTSSWQPPWIFLKTFLFTRSYG